MLWVISYSGKILLVDAGAAFPGEDMPGVDLLLPNTNFLEANQDRIVGLVLTNGHEEHCGAVAYLLRHIHIPRIMAPRFVSTLVSQALSGQDYDTVIDTVDVRRAYEVGPFTVEWIQVNDAIADACALRIGCAEGNIIYTSSFKLDQTPVDGKLLDVSFLAQSGEEDVLLLISDSQGVEVPGYTMSEKAVIPALEKQIKQAAGRVIIVTSGTNTHRLQIIFDLAATLGRKVLAIGETLMQTIVVAVITGNLNYDRKIEASLDTLSKLADKEILVVASGKEDDPMRILTDLAYGKCREFRLKQGDCVIYSADIDPGRSRHMAMILDQFMANGITCVNGVRDYVHVSNHAALEELKLMLCLTKPRYFAPSGGEGRHIVKHARLAVEWGMPAEHVFTLANGDALTIKNGIASKQEAIEATSVLYNRDQGERVTSFSVKERRVLSLEGVITIGLVVDVNGKLVSGPTVEANAAGFLRSHDWQTAKAEIIAALKEIVAGYAVSEHKDLNALRASLRETASKMIKGRFGAKPMLQVLIHELSTSRQ
jgi:ribonuclease J